MVIDTINAEEDDYLEKKSHSPVSIFIICSPTWRYLTKLNQTQNNFRYVAISELGNSIIQACGPNFSWCYFSHKQALI